jgi:hypothetical protein
MRDSTRSLPAVTRPWLTPPQYARELGVKDTTVLSWIRSGELVAINVAKPGAIRPRFRIHRSEAVAFEQRRLAGPAPKIQRRRRQPEGIIEFF